MKAKRTILFFLFLSALIPQAWAANFGEDDDYLGQVVDNYENDNNIAAMVDTINNSTLDCMELEYQPEIWSLENLTTYQETDASNVIDLLGDYYVLHEYGRNHEARMWYDFSEGYFNTNLSATFEVYNNNTIDGWNNQRFFLLCNQSNVNFEDLNEYVGLHVRKDGAENINFLFTIRNSIMGQLQDISLNINTQDWYYFDILFSGNNFTVNVWNDEAKTSLFDTLYLDGSTIFGGDWNFRYFYVAMALNDGYAKQMKTTSGKYRFLSKGYIKNGTYYTVNVLDGDPARVIFYNATIPSGTGMTMEFSTDNATWVNHNNQAGSDTLIAGYEALDLRDIYNGTIYRRVNQTSDGSETPRMWQEGFVTVTTITPSGDGLFPGLAIGISLLIIAAIYTVEKRR